MSSDQHDAADKPLRFPDELVAEAFDMTSKQFEELSADEKSILHQAKVDRLEKEVAQYGQLTSLNRRVSEIAERATIDTVKTLYAGITMITGGSVMAVANLHPYAEALGFAGLTAVCLSSTGIIIASGAHLYGDSISQKLRNMDR